jgi:hypothetical protein
VITETFDQFGMPVSADFPMPIEGHPVKQDQLPDSAQYAECLPHRSVMGHTAFAYALHLRVLDVVVHLPQGRRQHKW